jgi:hypothetical protein
MGIINVFYKSKFLTTFLRYLISFIFIMSAATKMSDFHNTLVYFIDIFGLSFFTTKLSLVFLILLEITIAILITFRLFNAQIIYTITISLLLFFIFIGIFFLFMGIKNCGCFGTIYTVKPLPTILKNLFMTAILMILKRNVRREGHVS